MKIEPVQKVARMTVRETLHYAEKAQPKLYQRMVEFREAHRQMQIAKGIDPDKDVVVSQ
jgi:hypothetical protein